MNTNIEIEKIETEIRENLEAHFEEAIEEAVHSAFYSEQEGICEEVLDDSREGILMEMMEALNDRTDSEELLRKINLLVRRAFGNEIRKAVAAKVKQLNAAIA
jgi:citrate lyase gamma subunit